MANSTIKDLTEGTPDETTGWIPFHNTADTDPKKINPSNLASLIASIPFNLLSAWDSGTTYNLMDVVSLNGSSYISKTTNTNSSPDSNPSDWLLLAEKGTAGANGEALEIRRNGIAQTGTGYLESRLGSGSWGNLYLPLVSAGAWSNTPDYTPGDVVTYLGNSYVCIAYTNGNHGDPASTTGNWSLFVAKGNTGDDGPNNVTTSTTTNLTGPIVGNGATLNAVTPFTDGTYTVGLGGSTNGTITIVNGIITNITQAS